jgi:hypothetical protein
MRMLAVDVADNNVDNSALVYRREPTETQANEEASGSEQTYAFMYYLKKRHRSLLGTPSGVANSGVVYGR